MKTLHEAAPEPLTSDQEKALSAEAKTGPFQHTTPSYGNDMQSGETPRLSSKRHAGSTPPAAPAPVVPEGDVVVSWNEDGQIVAVTRQDEEGRILSVIAESAAPAVPADAALNTLARLFHNGEEVESDDGAAMVVDLSLWHEASEALDSLIGDGDSETLASPAAPPAAPAVPLTDEQLAKIAVEDEFLLYCDQDSFNEIARAIERAHGIGK